MMKFYFRFIFAPAADNRNKNNNINGMQSCGGAVCVCCTQIAGYYTAIPIRSMAAIIFIEKHMFVDISPNKM